MTVMDNKQVAKRFGKAVLMDIAAEHELEVDPTVHVYDLAKRIIDNLAEDGILEDEISEESFDLYVALGYIDEDGNVIEDTGSVDDVGEEGGVEETLPEKLPQCYGVGDPENDPACKRCRISGECVALRMKTQSGLPCYGKLYDGKSQECTHCDLWRFCKREMETKR